MPLQTLMLMMLLMMTMLLEKVNPVEIGQDYGEDIKPAKGTKKTNEKGNENICMITYTN